MTINNVLTMFFICVFDYPLMYRRYLIVFMLISLYIVVLNYVFAGNEDVMLHLIDKMRTSWSSHIMKFL